MPHARFGMTGLQVLTSSCGPHLVHVGFDRCSLPHGVAELLGDHCPGLRSVLLNDARMSGEGVDDPANLRGQEVVQLAAKLPLHLQRLHIAGASLSDEQCASMAGLPCLVSLDASRTSVAAAGLRAVMMRCRLTALSLCQVRSWMLSQLCIVMQRR